MKDGLKYITFCSTSLAQYDRRIQRITKTLSTEYQIQWISRGELDVSWLKHKQLNPLLSKGFFFYAIFNIRLFFSLLFSKCDIICAIDLDTVLPCFLVSKLRMKTLVFDAHEFFTEVPELEGRDFVKSVWTWVEKLCLSRIKNNYTVGPELSKIFAERHGTKYEVIRNLPFKSNANSRRKHDGKTIVYLGMVNEGRGVELAIESLLQLKEKKLKIIGSGDLEEAMKRRVEELNLEDRVSFLGYITPTELSKELADCWIAVNMLNPISKSYYYSLANKFFDYMQAGIPTINMSFPEYKAVFDKVKTGCLVKEYNLRSLIEGINCLDNEQYYKSCVEDINSMKSQYTWESEAEKLLEFYLNLG